MSVPNHALRRGAALLLLTGHLGWATVRTWRAVDWESLARPREDRLSLLERTYLPLRQALVGQERVGYVRLAHDDQRWNAETRLQLQYLLAPVLLDTERREQPVVLIEQRCDTQRCTPGPEQAPGGRARDLELGLLLVEQVTP